MSRPLDVLLSTVLSSTVSVSSRLSDDLAEEIKHLDVQTDQIFQLCHFAVFCTSDGEKAQRIRSIGRVLELLETDLVPALLQLYYNPEDSGAKSFVKILRTLWKSLLENLSAAILDIVDPTAYCVILAEEVANIGKKVHIKNQYELYSFYDIF